MNESIDDLRSRWESDPSPQLSLQLAEEYRRLDRRDDAVEVLSHVLDQHPEHVASRVAMGRCRIEMGDLEEARRSLEEVVNEDPTQLVAGKLLINLYLDIGDKRLARDRLDLYRLLNESDPEVEVMEERLAADSTPGDAAPVVDERVIRVDVPSNGDPFGNLGSGVDSPAYWQAIGAEGIFPVSGTRESEPVRQEVPGATATLANLYLQQGHFDDAEKAFRGVLERHPGNAAAQAGLQNTLRQREEGVSAEGNEEASPAEPDAQINTRKIEALKDYLQRFRAAANRD